MAPTVLYDACVLYPAPLRDLLMRLAMAKLFQARWTDEIHDEWTRSVAADRPDLSTESLARCRRLMDEHVPDSLVTGYESLIPGLSLPDPDDRHVLAAAIHGGAGHIVTFNLSDFPASVLGGYSIEAIHPDEFIVNLWGESPDAVLDAVSRQRASLKNPPRSAVELLATLEQCGLAETVARLRAHAGGI
ncbi:PIN domain-containing protein [Paludisphaera mucosa]|uniref:PIN domain-containing protein n=1 Tax=Paludisphaera mucosa TaxID=3030827 RepID=A0ABT6FLP1_9BACT|nr:PIN domain-containing protein [Paludisphaera mucosa]MDG3008479.1 PIN domain-containing protein [Paludisphaera mucosa]